MKSYFINIISFQKPIILSLEETIIRFILVISICRYISVLLRKTNYPNNQKILNNLLSKLKYLKLLSN